MIIDFHAHWWPSDRFVHAKSSWEKLINGINNKFYKEADIDLSDNELRTLYFDPDGSKILEQMKNAGINMTVLLPLDWGNMAGMPEIDILEQNEVYAHLSKKHPDSIISFFSIDPVRDHGDQYFIKAIKEWGMKGLKLYPPTGFFPYDDICMPFYKICLDYDLPVVFHGTISPFSPTAYSHPDCFKLLAEKLPKLKIVIAHAGRPTWHKKAINACHEYENIYLDISSFQSIFDQKLFKDKIINMYLKLKTFGKVLFGTDSPIFNGMCKVKDMVLNLQDLNTRSKFLHSFWIYLARM